MTVDSAAVLAALNVTGSIAGIAVGASVILGDEEMDHLMKRLHLRKEEEDRDRAARPPRHKRPHRWW